MAYARGELVVLVHVSEGLEVQVHVVHVEVHTDIGIVMLRWLVVTKLAQVAVVPEAVRRHPAAVALQPATIERAWHSSGSAAAALLPATIASTRTQCCAS